MDELKTSNKSYVGFFILKFLCSYLNPSYLFEKNIVKVWKDAGNVFVSNINGPSAPLQIGSGFTKKICFMAAP